MLCPHSTTTLLSSKVYFSQRLIGFILYFREIYVTDFFSFRRVKIVEALYRTSKSFNPVNFLRDLVEAFKWIMVSHE